MAAGIRAFSVGSREEVATCEKAGDAVQRSKLVKKKESTQNDCRILIKLQLIGIGIGIGMVVNLARLN